MGVGIRMGTVRCSVRFSSVAGILLCRMRVARGPRDRSTESGTSRPTGRGRGSMGRSRGMGTGSIGITVRIGFATGCIRSEGGSERKCAAGGDSGREAARTKAKARAFGWAGGFHPTLRRVREGWGTRSASLVRGMKSLQTSSGLPRRNDFPIQQL
jgi:hypothetical protein